MSIILAYIRYFFSGNKTLRLFDEKDTHYILHNEFEKKNISVAFQYVMSFVQNTTLPHELIDIIVSYCNTEYTFSHYPQYVIVEYSSFTMSYHYDQDQYRINIQTVDPKIFSHKTIFYDSFIDADFVYEEPYATLSYEVLNSYMFVKYGRVFLRSDIVEYYKLSGDRYSFTYNFGRKQYNIIIKDHAAFTNILSICMFLYDLE